MGPRLRAASQISIMIIRHDRAPDRIPGGCSPALRRRLSARCGTPGKLAAAIAMNRRGMVGVLRNNHRREWLWRDEPEGRSDGMRFIEEVVKKDSRGLQP